MVVEDSSILSSVEHLWQLAYLQNALEDALQDASEKRRNISVQC
jgi:hypothetical protein